MKLAREQRERLYYFRISGIPRRAFIVIFAHVTVHEIYDQTFYSSELNQSTLNICFCLFCFLDYIITNLHQHQDQLLAFPLQVCASNLQFALCTQLHQDHQEYLLFH